MLGCFIQARQKLQIGDGVVKLGMEYAGSNAAA